MDLQGRIKFISQAQTFGSGFQKREIVLTTEEQYPQHVIFEFTQDKCALLDNYRLGQLVKISFNVRGREWTNPQGEVKYFNSLQGWRIEDMEVQYQQQPQYQQAQYQQPPQYQQFAQQQQYPPQQPQFAQNQAYNTPQNMGFETTPNIQNNDIDDLPF